MQKYFIYYLPVAIALALTTTISVAQGKVGINTTTPAAGLHVMDSSVLFSGIYPLPASPGNAPVSGAGTRLMWYPDKAAFRVGRVTATQWDKVNVGNYSFASGYNCQASGVASGVFGQDNIVSATVVFKEFPTPNYTLSGPDEDNMADFSEMGTFGDKVP